MTNIMRKGEEGKGEGVLKGGGVLRVGMFFERRAKPNAYLKLRNSQLPFPKMKLAEGA
jgi:hypothetical protein